MYPLEEKDIKVLQIACHRNGVAGAGFYAVRFIYDKELYLAIDFGENQLAVLRVDPLSNDQEGVEFGVNSYRYEYFVDVIRDSISKWEKIRTDKLIGVSS